MAEGDRFSKAVPWDSHYDCKSFPVTCCHTSPFVKTLIPWKCMRCLPQEGEQWKIDTKKEHFILLCKSAKKTRTSAVYESAFSQRGGSALIYLNPCFWLLLNQIGWIKRSTIWYCAANTVWSNAIMHLCFIYSFIYCLLFFFQFFNNLVITSPTCLHFLAKKTDLINCITCQVINH